MKKAKQFIMICAILRRVFLLACNPKGHERLSLLDGIPEEMVTC